METGNSEEEYAGHTLDRGDDSVFRLVNCVRVLLRARELMSMGWETEMSLESMIMLAVSALTMVYLVYALLRPEKF